MSLRLAVTTSADSSPRWADSVTAAGHVPVSLPCIEVRPRAADELDFLRKATLGADLLLLTSARSVGFLWPDEAIPDVAIAAVGRATAEAARAAGGRVEFVGDAGGDSLVASLLDAVSGKRVVFPHAGGSDLSRIDRLRAAGARVVAGAVYDSIPVAPANDPVDAALFGSPSAVAGWLMARTLAEAGLVGAIGDTTAAEIARHLGHAPVVSAVPSVESLVSALSDALKGNHESVPPRP